MLSRVLIPSRLDVPGQFVDQYGDVLELSADFISSKHYYAFEYTARHGIQWIHEMKIDNILTWVDMTSLKFKSISFFDFVTDDHVTYLVYEKFNSDVHYIKELSYDEKVNLLEHQHVPDEIDVVSHAVYHKCLRWCDFVPSSTLDSNRADIYFGISHGRQKNNDVVASELKDLDESFVNESIQLLSRPCPIPQVVKKGSKPILPNWKKYDSKKHTTNCCNYVRRKCLNSVLGDVKSSMPKELLEIAVSNLGTEELLRIQSMLFKA